MGIVLAIISPLGWINEKVLGIGRAIGVIAVAAMVAAILIQVVFRYVFNNALPWPDEAARFCMLWMTGLMAPTAFRRGGFVAIDMLCNLLPRTLGTLLNLFLLTICLAVLLTAVKIGWSEVTGFGGRFATASLFVPVSLDLSEWLRVPRSWMMASMLVCIVLLISVNIELILRTLVALFGGRDRLKPILTSNTSGAE
ncbi:TRAP transporter small permease [Roseibium polysiphoniae]|uniref:TRAP transporter small permease protein n=1 Tax=Roseibium polysiphoniae TaxID=2571221 RepID=A0ABR9CAV9_9HYPH|nr:TRAP transporter small permease [Roseibium polysiphoniae]MBD8876215.1 TRAP transporter small permease [Roseibium polysiphoniae]